MEVLAPENWHNNSNIRKEWGERNKYFYSYQYDSELCQEIKYFL